MIPGFSPASEVIHQSVRLRLMCLLTLQRDVSFGAARTTLGLTAGNLAFHAKALEGHGLLEQRQALNGDGLSTRLRITTSGDRAYAQYLADLRRIIEATRTETRAG